LARKITPAAQQLRIIPLKKAIKRIVTAPIPAMVTRAALLYSRGRHPFSADSGIATLLPYRAVAS
jgi:hypothetical protein